ncbi:MAG TPA: VWA domain-containing protein, partial [Polyangiaceae bacterium]|nr:VWA domain-containing protein [Polyangiaceae bacterium]
ATAQTGWIDGSPIQTRLRVGADGSTYVGVWINAPQQPGAARARAPMAISLVVDTSGSMAGEKIQNARMAAASLLESASDGDIVSIYAFSTTVTEFAPPTVVGPNTRSQLMQRVSQLYASGGTNLYGGMQAAIGRMGQAPRTHPIRRVFLISDGHANVGPSDTTSLSNLAAGATEWGTQVTAIGVGHSYDQATLSAMVVRSSGRLYHLSQPQQMANILQSEMNLLARSVALNAYIEIIPAPGVRFLETQTTGAQLTDGRVRLPLGAVFAGQHRELLFRAQVDTARPGQRRLAQARLVYQDPSGNQERIESAQLRYEVTADARAAQASRAPAVEAMVANHQATQSQRRAAQLMREGQSQGAAVALRRARDALAAAARRAPRSESSARLRERATRMDESAGAAAAAPPAAAPAMSYDLADDAMQAEGY